MIKHGHITPLKEVILKFLTVSEIDGIKLSPKRRNVKYSQEVKKKKRKNTQLILSLRTKREIKYTYR